MPEPIAIVGSACRFPGSVRSPSQLWRLLMEQRDALESLAPQRLGVESFYDENPDHHGRTNVKGHAYLLQEDPRQFDASFFRISYKEAHAMDPQQRILLETVYEAFEAAGWPLDQIEGSETSVHVGCMTSDYHDMQMRDPETLSTYTATGTARSILSNRISYIFDLRGPSITLDTACSSSLVALHQAVQCIRNGEAHQAVVAGTTLLLDAAMWIAESNLHMLSPDSRSRMWDEGANGYARGEGCAAILLKPLSAAIAANDHIECIIRESGVNSDGSTGGITMPSPSAQASLIKRTYERAGLDPVRDRCQYFECHGTGTQAGDPVEAQAIHEAFFPPGVEPSNGEPLFCGSIKTAIGHLEGCAGLAGLLKASLALQHSTIPPNMHFREINPAIAPYYDGLQVPTSALPWPETNGGPLRASVNSFGFGGTNAHVIIESYCPPIESAAEQEQDELHDSEDQLIGPFVFSASTSSSLLEMLKEIRGFIHDDPEVDLDALSWVLQLRRTQSPCRAVAVATSRAHLLDELDQLVATAQDTKTIEEGAAIQDQPQGILGIFTGQGAQWSGMGCQLLKHSQCFRDSLKRCEESLKTIPHPPSWSLIQQLNAPIDESHVDEAQFTQPICTAIQIGLVDLLQAAGVTLGVVVGHSSGEIAAAYAAGILSTRDAMGIAYYRGAVAHLARGVNSDKGGMLAVGMSFAHAQGFCAQPTFYERIEVAASNGPSIVTLSGDLDALQEARSVFDAKGIFARIVKVDVAYHSHHMRRCEAVYGEYLRGLKIQLHKGNENCNWYSTVHQHMDFKSGSPDCLRGSYWVDNMTRPVLFSQALSRVASEGYVLAMAVEIGPHPALRRPTILSLKHETILSEDQLSKMYSGSLYREQHDVLSIARLVGNIWKHISRRLIDFSGWRRAFGRKDQPQILKRLPLYPWDHNQPFWSESRISKTNRLESRRPHQLLGRVYEDHLDKMTWRNVLFEREIPWLVGHRFQGQILFPAAGYVNMAVAAAQQFARGRAVTLVEIRDLHIGKALALDHDNDGVETLFTVTCDSDRTETTKADHLIRASFSCQSCSDGQSLTQNCSGRLLIHLGIGDPVALPQFARPQSELPDLETSKFFTALARLGIEYSGPFRAIHSINRIWGCAASSASWAADELASNQVAHPAVLDVAFQTGFATFLSMAEEAMATTFLPATIKRVIVDTSQSYQGPVGDIEVNIDARLTSHTRSKLEIDVSIRSGTDDRLGIQVDGLVLQAIAEPQPLSDRQLFAKTKWDIDVSYGFKSPPLRTASVSDFDYIEAVERTSLFYLQKTLQNIRPEEIPDLKWHHKALLEAIEVLIKPIQQGAHPLLSADWLMDDSSTIEGFNQTYPHSVDIALLAAVGTNLPSVMRGESEMLEHMLKDDLLSRLYTEGRGFSTCNDHVAEYVRQIAHKYPRAKILEIGAGTGGTTQSVLEALEGKYSLYTYTDISTGFFERARERFRDTLDRMDFKAFNIETPPTAQGFSLGSYDIVIAANVLHATRDLAGVVQDIRTLLKPGGFLVAVEVTGSMLRELGLMGGLEGWWLGRGEGRFPNPGLSIEGWDQLLRRRGFSGVDTVAYDMPDIQQHNCSVFVTQALDNRCVLLRDPIKNIGLINEPRLLIIGGRKPWVADLIYQARNALLTWASNITIVPAVDLIDMSELSLGSTILNLSELDQPLFSSGIEANTLQHLQSLFTVARNVLWVTSGRLAEEPHENMMLGAGRAIRSEMPQLRLKFLDFEDQSGIDIHRVLRHLLEMILCSDSKFSDEPLTWAEEPEIRLAGHNTLIPRLVPDSKANGYLNATRREVKLLVDASDGISVSYDREHPYILNPRMSFSTPKGFIDMDVALSVNLSPRGRAPCFLCFGYMRNSHIPVFAISANNTSLLRIHEDSTFNPEGSSHCDPLRLVRIGLALVVNHIASIDQGHGTVLLHDPPREVATLIMEAKMELGRKVLCISPNMNEHVDGWLCIHPMSSIGEVRRLIPRDTSSFWRFSNVDCENIMPCLPQSAKVDHFNPGSMSCKRELLARSYQVAILTTLQPHPVVIGLGEIETISVCEAPLSTVLNWDHTGPIEATIQPFDAETVFSPDKTYFLVGMMGDLGQSLCRFMSSSGARHIVISSRSAIDETPWIKGMRDEGVNIRARKMDVADRDDLCPPVAGVANAALVLEDSLFANATVESIEAQLKPKVDGSVNLDAEFGGEELDFFILFSSLGSEYGNPGQSIYHAANLFMTSFAEKRRKRGQCASVMSIGMCVDVGYVARNTRRGANVEAHLRSQFYAPLAESDLHQLFVEAVLAGSPQSANAELTIGIEPFVDDPSAEYRPSWHENPRFSHMIVPPSIMGEPGRRKTSAGLGMHGRLEAARSRAEVFDVLQHEFRCKVEALTKIPSATMSSESPLSVLGLDSLLAIEIRTWLFKEFLIDVPILGILGNQSISSICSRVADSYQAKLNSPGQQTEPEPIGTKSHSRDSDDEISSGTSIPTLPSLTGSFVEDHENSDNGFSLSSQGSDDQRNETPDRMVEDSMATRSKAEQLSAQLSSYKVQTIRNTPMTSAQASLYFLTSISDEPSALNVTAQYAITGSLSVTRLRRALETTMLRHDAFQMCFFTDAESVEPRQGLLESPAGGCFTHVQSRDHMAVEHEFHKLSNQVWELESGHTFHATVITHSPHSHTILFGVHHMVMDGMSWHLFLRDLNCAYSMQSPQTCPSSTLELSIRQREFGQQGLLDSSVEYWLRNLNPVPDVIPLLPLARRAAREPQTAWRNNVIRRDLTAGLVQKLEGTSQKCNVTVMHFFLATVQSLFARMLRIEEICIGVTTAGRDGGYLDTVGHFAILQPVLFKFRMDQTFTELLQKTAVAMVGAMGHPGVSIDMILPKLGITRSATHPPLCQVAFNYRVGSLLHRRLGNCSMDLVQYNDATTPLDLTFNVTHGGSGRHMLEVVSNAALYSAADTEVIMDIYCDLLETFAGDQTYKIADHGLYSKARVVNALGLARGPATESMSHTLIGRLCEVADTLPNNIAIKSCGVRMTYTELFTHVRGLAADLVAAKVGPGTPVAVLCEPSIDLWLAMLAILYCGAIYIPFDPILPTKRHGDMLRVCKPKLLLFHDATVFASQQAIWNNITQMDLRTRDRQTCDAPTPALGRDEAFWLFTSGSTGKPKCIRLTQSGILNYALSKQSILRLEHPIVLQQSSVGFDMSLAQAFNAFVNAGTLVVAPPEIRGDPSAIAQLISDESVNFTLATPTEYTMLTTYASEILKGCSHWRYACSGGEVVTDGLIASLQQLELIDLVLADCYGPTEVSCAATIHTMLVSSQPGGNNSPTSVGTPIANMSVYILGDYQELLPAGLAGEICIGGVGVAKGYVDAELTAERFVRVRLPTETDTLIYKTGDRGCLRHDGSLVFLGRINGDSLIKLRGNRIELSEIEQTIISASRGSLVDATVTIRGQPEFLVAHVLASQGQHPDVVNLDHLRRNLPLPSYMVPAVVIPVDSLPTTTNGKVDRNAVSALPLPLPANDGCPITHCTTSDVTEGELRILWRRVLGGIVTETTRISSTSDFFGVGGSSLLLVRLQSTIREAMGVKSHSMSFTKQAHCGRTQLPFRNIDWKAETGIPGELLDMELSPITTLANQDQRNVILTGATSFLGGEILNQLIKDLDVANIYCVAVAAHDRHRIPTLARVTVYTGSLMSPDFGLSNKAITDLRSRVDQIIHAGASGHCLNNYSSVRTANYLSTQRLAALALPRRAPLHFISSPRVILQSGSCAMPPGSMASYPPPTDGSQGFSSSKWVSEVFLENISNQMSLPVVVHRPCSVIGSRAPHDDAMNSIIRYSYLSGRVPDVPGAEGFFDFKDVTDVARDIVNSAAPSEGIAFYQYSSGVKVPFSDLSHRMEVLYGRAFERVHLSEWIDGAAKLGLEDLIVSYLEANVAGGQKLVFPYMGEE
ncbi:polyketide synthase [Apiospora rasikravindrae]|uniref:Polyketide synthase n=1 Tax=Apiospora rasikravindrae TaxID=990691 RepID=A0ABR1S2T5_9PEZI